HLKHIRRCPRAESGMWAEPGSPVCAATQRAARRAASGRLLDGAAAPGCLGTQPGDRRLEVLERVEALVDAREAAVGDEGQLLERLEDRQPHLVRVDLRVAAGAEALLDALGGPRQLIIADRPPLTGLAHPGGHLGPAEGLAHAGPLEHGEGGRLRRGETARAVGALAPAPDRRAVVRCAGVDDAGVGIATERAVHPPRIAARGPLSGSPAPRPAAR